MSNKYVIGIDPDSSEHGIAIYVNGELEHLYSLSLTEFIDLIKMRFYQEEKLITVHIEDVCAVSAVFCGRYKKIDNQPVKSKVSQRVGMCKQAQTEIERVCAWLGIKVVKHKISKRWKSQSEKQVFMRVTGWEKNSNEDTRSAAYFGYMGSRNQK